MEGAGFADPFLAWDDDNEWWTFDGGPVDERPLSCFLLARQSPPPEDCLEHARHIVRWLRASERQLRRAVAVGMVEYLAGKYIREPGKDEDDTPEKIEPNLRIAEVEIIETSPARINYAARGPLASMNWPWRAGVSLAVDRAGVVVRGPEFAGLCAPERIIWPN